LIRGGVGIIVFDSVAAALPQSEQQKRLHGENHQPARLASLMSAAMRRLTAANENTAVIWINQFRLNVGVTFGNPQVATGGKALPYYSSFIMDVQKTGKINEPIKLYDGDKWRDGQNQVGQKFKATLSKSKLSKPMTEMNFVWDLRAGQIDISSFLMAQGLEIGVITQKGASWVFDGRRVIGKDKFHGLVMTDPEIQAKLTTMIREHHFGSRGQFETGSPKAAGSKRVSSSAKVPGPTPAVAPAGSNMTEAPAKSLSRSRTLKRATRSKPVISKGSTSKR
jgi:recombination protein RecA